MGRIGFIVLLLVSMLCLFSWTEQQILKRDEWYVLRWGTCSRKREVQYENFLPCESLPFPCCFYFAFWNTPPSLIRQTWAGARVKAAGLEREGSRQRRNNRWNCQHRQSSHEPAVSNKECVHKDTFWHAVIFFFVVVVFKLPELSIIWLSTFVRAARSAFAISSRVSQFYGQFCMFRFIYEETGTGKKMNK